jgi:hypothetical protein
MHRAVEEAQSLKQELYASILHEEQSKQQDASAGKRSSLMEDWKQFKRTKASDLGVSQLVDGVEDHDLFVPSMRPQPRHRYDSLML